MRRGGCARSASGKRETEKLSRPFSVMPSVFYQPVAPEPGDRPVQTTGWGLGTSFNTWEVDSGWGQWRGWLWIAGFRKVSEVQGCVHGHSSWGRVCWGERGQSPGSTSALQLGEAQCTRHLVHRDLHVPTVRLPQSWRPAPCALRRASWAGFQGRASVVRVHTGRPCPRRPSARTGLSHVVAISSLGAGAGLPRRVPPERRPCSPRAPPTGTHRAFVYLLKIYFEGFLFCFVSLLDTLE